MEQERMFLAALGARQRFSIAADGALLMQTIDGRNSKARRRWTGRRESRLQRAQVQHAADDQAGDGRGEVLERVTAGHVAEAEQIVVPSFAHEACTFEIQE